MQIFSNQTSKEQRRLWEIFTPSFLSILISLLVVLAVVGSTIFITVYSTNAAPDFLSALGQNDSNTSLKHVYNTASNFMNGNSAFSDAPLTIFWAMVGVGVYALVMSGGSLIRSMAETEREVQFMHMDRDEFVRVTLIRLLMRLLAIVLAWFVLAAFVRYLLPYSVAATHVAVQGNWVQHIIYSLGASVSLVLGLHVVVVILRVIWFRVRLFT